jgi:membrane associated rhomboid family serine protease
MFPIDDDDTARRTVPLVTYALIALNVLFFFVELSGGDAFIMKWAFVPSRFLSNPFSDFLTLFTSMFMHAGWVHLGGNMLYLWIFGDNVEDRFGHIQFTISTYSVGLRQLLHSWRLASDQTCRIWEHQERLPVCSALTFCCSRRERSRY